MRVSPVLQKFLGLFFLLGSAFCFAQTPEASAASLWNLPAFQASAADLRTAAAGIKPEKRTDATILLREFRYGFDAEGRMTVVWRMVYRIENENGVTNWAETSGVWEPWHQSKPEIRARVITADAEHWLDAKTLTDVPVNEDEPDVYSDTRRYGGPLPAVAIGALVEEEVTTRDAAPLFSAGYVRRIDLGLSAPSELTRIVITHPAGSPLHWRLNVLPEARVTQSTVSGEETLTFVQGRLAAFNEPSDHLPADLVIEPQFEFSTGTSWKAVADEYARLAEEKIRPAEVQSLLAKTNLKDGPRDARIGRIVAALHKNVRYTGIEFGQASLVPQPPAETLKRKYGDCKDKAALLVTLLRAAGIPAHLALLNAGSGQDIDTDQPGVGLFNHAIVYVPASGSDPELWIDATAQYSRVGTLPQMDYGRRALVIAQLDDPLKRIPELSAEQNIHREQRIFDLADYGMATIHEVNEDFGPGDANTRQYYSNDTKEIRQQGESYVKSVYLAESLSSLEHSDLNDLEHPATLTLTAKGRRGNTDLSSSVAAIRLEQIFNTLPSFFLTPEEKPKAEENPDDKAPERKADWALQPFITEWHYKVTAPAGFTLRALPENKSEKIEGLVFSQQYSANAAGTVAEATLRLESRITRLTVVQAKQLRDAVVKARSADAVLITFDQAGRALIAAGKTREGLVLDRELAARSPKDAMPRIRLADALLSVGLGEEARSVAQEAVKLDSKSALAWRTLGNILENDLIGRPVAKGMDYPAALAAFRKALELDPKDKDARVALAILLEYNPEGERYQPGSSLKEAVAILKDLKKLDEDFERPYEDNVLYDLLYARDFAGVVDYAAAIPSSNERKGLMLAATALLNGTDAALQKSLVLASDEKSRKAALSTAGVVLIRLQKYPEAAACYAEAAKGEGGDQSLARSAALLAKTHPFSEVKFDPTDPSSLVLHIYGGVTGGTIPFAEFKSLTFGNLDYTNDPLEKQYSHMLSHTRVQMSSNNLPRTTSVDIATSSVKITLDGSGELGYKATVEFAGSQAQTAYLWRDEGQLKMLAASLINDSNIDPLAVPALRELERNNLPAARKWLDRARDRLRISGGDDPLSGATFPYFWTKGQQGDANAIRIAALHLLDSKLLTGDRLEAIRAARNAATADADRNRIDKTLAYAYLNQERWEEMFQIAVPLAERLPNSPRAASLAVSACSGVRRFEPCETLLRKRIQDNPEEYEYQRSLSQLLAERGDFANARQVLKPILDKGQASSEDLNSYSWLALFMPAPVGEDSHDAAQRANELTRQSNYAVLHTLACVNAVTGRANQARPELLAALKANNLEEPDSSLWLALGMIAEQYGEYDAARKMYARVEKDKHFFPTSSYELAQLRLAAMPKETPGEAKPSGKKGH